MTMRVGSGSARPTPANMVSNTGMTKISSTQMAIDGHAHDHGRVDHRALHLPDEGVVLFHERRQAHQDRVEDTAGLTGGDHVHVQLAERLRVLGAARRRPCGPTRRRTRCRASTPESTLFSVCLARMSSACTSGRPALIIVENCRVKMTMSRILMQPVIFLGFASLVDLDDGHPLPPELRDDILRGRGFDRCGLQFAALRFARCR